MSLRITVEKEMPASSEAVWAVLSNFSDMSWAGFTDVIVEGDGVGAVRAVRISPDGKRAHERLDALDVQRKYLAYSVLDGNPLPVKNLSGEIKVIEESAGVCKVAWSATADGYEMDDKSLAALLSSLYETVLAALAKHLSR